MKMISEAITAGSLRAIREEVRTIKVPEEERRASHTQVWMGDGFHQPNRKERRAIEAEERRSAKRKAAVK